MNIEELKIVLETIRSLSGDASTAVYVYFGLEFAKVVIGLAVGAWVALTLIKSVASASGVDQDTAFMRECRDELKTGTGGELTHNERKATQIAIRKLIWESKQ
jgi:uncharacterized membrane protein